MNKIIITIITIISYLLIINILTQTGIINVDIIGYKTSDSGKIINPHTRDSQAYTKLAKKFTGTFSDVEVKTNSIGLRDKEYSVETNKTRIIVIGDSITFGFGVKQNETYPKILESLFNENVEVWNAGVNSYNTYQINIQLQNLLKYNPDLVVYGFFQNDISYEISFLYDQDIFLQEHPFFKLVDKTVFEKIGFYRFIRKKMYYMEENKQKDIYYKDFQISPEQNKEALKEIVEKLKEENISLIVLNIPYLLKKDYLSKTEQEEIKKYREDYTIIDILPEYQKVGKNWYKLLRTIPDDDKHPNYKGHKLIANRLYEEIIQKNLVK